MLHGVQCIRLTILHVPFIIFGQLASVVLQYWVYRMPKFTYHVLNPWVIYNKISRDCTFKILALAIIISTGRLTFIAFSAIGLISGIHLQHLHIIYSSEPMKLQATDAKLHTCGHTTIGKTTAWKPSVCGGICSMFVFVNNGKFWGTSVCGSLFMICAHE